AHLGRHADELAPERWAERAADVWLACACANGDTRALHEFEARFRPLVDSVLARMRMSDAALDDARQSVRDRLLVAAPGQPAGAGGCPGRGGLAGWVRAAATRVALNLIRGRRETSSDEELLARVPAAGDDPELAVLKSRYGPAFHLAFRDAL